MSEVRVDVTGRPVELGDLELDRFFAPRAIAVIGASDKPGSAATLNYRLVRDWQKQRADGAGDREHEQATEADEALTEPVERARLVAAHLDGTGDVFAVEEREHQDVTHGRRVGLLGEIARHFRHLEGERHGPSGGRDAGCPARTCTCSDPRVAHGLEP